jgi:hypothetical protein
VPRVLANADHVWSGSRAAVAMMYTPRQLGAWKRRFEQIPADGGSVPSAEFSCPDLQYPHEPARIRHSPVVHFLLALGLIRRPRVVRRPFAIRSPTVLSMLRQYSKARSRTGFVAPSLRRPTTLETSRSRWALSMTLRTRVPAWPKSSSSRASCRPGEQSRRLHPRRAIKNPAKSRSSSAR